MAVSITGVSGSFLHGGSLTITGSGFGTKAAAAPTLWDPFASGTLGQALTTQGWGTWPTGASGVYSNTRARRAGGQSAKFSVSGTGEVTGTRNQKTGLSLTEAFISLWVYIEQVSGARASNFKLFRLNVPDLENPGDQLHGSPSIGLTAFPTRFSPYTMTMGATYSAPEVSVDLVGGWHNLASYAKLGTADVADGVRRFWRDTVGIPEAWGVPDPLITLGAADDAVAYSQFNLGSLYCNFSAAAQYDIYVSDLWIDADQARVVLGNAPTWAGCTIHEMQPWSAWATGEITITANLGAFADDATAYLYVVDASGVVNANGYEITLDAGYFRGMTTQATLTGVGA